MVESLLVAGGAGYIGSHTAKYIRDSGAEPVVIDNLCTGYRENARFGPFYEASIGDKATIREVINRHNIQTAILLAAHAYVGESVLNPRKYYLNNIAESLAFLEALLDAGVRQLIFSSSCSIYGNQDSGPIDETKTPDPLSPYAESKHFIERMLAWYGKAEGLRSVCLRYFNAAGADPGGELGEAHEPETHLIPLAIRSAMGFDPLQVFGTNYPTPDGTAIRDYVHVTDLASAHFLAARYLVQGGDSIQLNLGTGRGCSIREVMNTVEAISGKAVRYLDRPRREGDAPSLVADASKAAAVLGWTPRYSRLEDIISTAWNWHTRASLAAYGPGTQSK